MQQGSKIPAWISNSFLLFSVVFAGWLYYYVHSTTGIVEENFAGLAERSSRNIIRTMITLETTKGDVTLELFNDKAPKTTKNFINLTRKGFYDGIKFHRVIPSFMIQGGDPLTKGEDERLYGTGGPGYSFEDEFGEGLSNVTGTISMANSGPNTNGSQFFINVADNVFLDGKHAVFGKVIKGMDVVLDISNAARNQNDLPLDDILIKKVTIKE